MMPYTHRLRIGIEVRLGCDMSTYLIGEAYIIYGCIAWRASTRLLLHWDFKLAGNQRRTGHLEDRMDWLEGL